MKGITKDHESITKVFGSLFYSMKDQCKKKFALHLRPYIPIFKYCSGVSSIYDIIEAFKLPCKIFRICDTFQKISRICHHCYYFTLRQLYANTAYIHS